MNFRRFINFFRVSFFTELNDSRPSVERRLPIIKKVLWQSQQHLQEGFRPMGVLDRVLCPGAFLSYNPARGAPGPMVHGTGPPPKTRSPHGGPGAPHGSIFRDFLAPRTDIKKRRIFESFKNWKNGRINRPWDAQGRLFDQKT